MVTMATNPFCESMGQRVTCMKALHLHVRLTLESTCVDPNIVSIANRFVMHLMCRETAEVKLECNMTAHCIN